MSEDKKPAIDPQQQMRLNELVKNQVKNAEVQAYEVINGTLVPIGTKTTTNASGVISIQIGANPLGLSFSSINWINGPFYLKTEIDPTGGSNYTINGISELLSVPYSLYAQNAYTVNGLVAVINGGTGAKTPTLARVNLGLGNVDNTRDVDKPISKKVQSALNSKANLEDPVFVGFPEAPTAKVGNNTNQIANTIFVNDAIKRATPDATATVNTTAATMSGRDPFIRGDSDVTRHARTKVMKQMGTFTQNAERQPNEETKNAPRVGPDATPSAPIEPTQAITCPRFSAGNTPSNKPVDAGTIIAPPIPCTARPAISSPIVDAIAHNNEPTKK